MKSMTQTLWSSLLFLTASTSPAAEPALSRFTFAEAHMGTRFKIVLYASDEAAANAAAKAAFARVVELNRIMSDYVATSELMQLCEKSGGPPVQVSADLFQVLSRAQDLSRRSEGAFDVTVGPLVKLWRKARYNKKLPDAEELNAARALVGFDKLVLDEKARTVQLKKAGMKLDLGGIAKGYAADQIHVELRRLGITRALVAAGGDITVSDPPPDAKGWKVGIAPLEDPDSDPKRFFLLDNGAVSTSGDAEQYVEIDGKRYSHIVDPKTGLGLVGRMSVTVVARDGTTADSTTKIPCVLGPEKGMAFIEATEGVSAFMVRKTDKGEETSVSKRFPKMLEAREKK